MNAPEQEPGAPPSGAEAGRVRAAPGHVGAPEVDAALVQELAEVLRSRAVADDKALAAFPDGPGWEVALDEALTCSHVIDGHALRVEGQPEVIARAVLTWWAERAAMASGENPQ